MGDHSIYLYWPMLHSYFDMKLCSLMLSLSVKICKHEMQQKKHAAASNTLHDAQTGGMQWGSTAYTSTSI